MEDLGQSLREGLGTLGSMSVKGFDRAKQFSQEKMGNAVRTEYDLVSWREETGEYFCMWGKYPCVGRALYFGDLPLFFIFLPDRRSVMSDDGYTSLPPEYNDFFNSIFL